MNIKSLAITILLASATLNYGALQESSYNFRANTIQGYIAQCHQSIALLQQFIDPTAPWNSVSAQDLQKWFSLIIDELTAYPAVERFEQIQKYLLITGEILNAPTLTLEKINTLNTFISAK